MIVIKEVKPKENCVMIRIEEEHPMRPNIICNSWVCLPKGVAHEIWNYFRQFSSEQ